MFDFREIAEALRKSVKQNLPQNSGARRLLLERLAIVWDAAPELRLGQMICTASLDPFSAEDFDLISALERMYL